MLNIDVGLRYILYAEAYTALSVHHPLERHTLDCIAWMAHLGTGYEAETYT
jgi:hypothetical protein